MIEMQSNKVSDQLIESPSELNDSTTHSPTFSFTYFKFEKPG